jgi:inhibitor of cysteine peptidase
MKDHRLSESDNRTTVSAQIGDLIELRLNEMASAGYRWSVDSPQGHLLEALGEGSEYAKDRVGGANTACFQFRVKAAGSGVIRLHYGRPWATDEPPLKTYEVYILVR